MNDDQAGQMTGAVLALLAGQRAMVELMGIIAEADGFKTIETREKLAAKYDEIKALHLEELIASCADENMAAASALKRLMDGMRKLAEREGL